MRIEALRVEVWLSDGEIKTFKPEGRVRFQRSNTVEFVVEWVVVTDETGMRTAIPSHRVDQVLITPMTRRVS